MSHPIDEATWLRMPWHAKAQAVAAIAREERDLRRRLADARAALAEIEALFASTEQRLLATVETTRHILRAARTPTSTPEGARRAAHAAWNAGQRDEWVRVGEREYQRMRKRAQREAS